MKGKGKILKIYIGENDLYDDEPLYQELIKMLKEKGLAGATAMTGVEALDLTVE